MTLHFTAPTTIEMERPFIPAIKADELKAAASGRWRDIARAIGIGDDYLVRVLQIFGRKLISASVPISG